MKTNTTLRRATVATVATLALIAGAAVAPETALASGERGQSWPASVSCDQITRQIRISGNFTIAPGYDRQRVAWQVWIYSKTTGKGFYITNAQVPGSTWFVVDHNRVQWLYDPSWNSYTASYHDYISTGELILTLAKGEYRCRRSTAG